ncbi:hypothetical protein DERP_009583 [Dermatophagoides pteronyssinus]|uniref:Uncharacterized protein n=1 Tax=Dermatophagoides pteronyssinus TaxID=6956 RepID=A0ABQ8JAB0_DERPT|nr:hypothetical protein DERP_009583 [Dermatophagoides pteronyssinus]
MNIINIPFNTGVNFPEFQTQNEIVRNLLMFDLLINKKKRFHNILAKCDFVIEVIRSELQISMVSPVIESLYCMKIYI